MRHPVVHWLGRILPAPLDGGDRVYSAKLAGSLADAGAPVRYYGLINPNGPPVPDLRVLPSSVDWTFVSGKPRSLPAALIGSGPLVAERFATRAYRRLACSLAPQSSLVVLDQHAMVWVLDTPLAKRPIVYIAHDYETDVTQQIAKDYSGNPFKRLALQLNARKTALAERRLAAAADLVVTLTGEDAACFERVGAKRTLVLPPGANGAPVRRTITPETPRRVVLLGSFRWIAKRMNLVTFLAAADTPFADAGIALDVIGDVPDDLRLRLAPKLRSTTFRGYVDDLDAALANARLGIVAELTGGGFKLKTLDYIFAGLPVASLDAALTGLPQDIRASTLVSADVGALVQAIIDNIDDIEGLNNRQKRAAARAQSYFNWSSVGERFRHAINDLTESCRAA